MAAKVQIAIDCADPARLAEFWAAALGYKVQDPPDGYDTWTDYLVAIGVPETEWNSASAVVDPDGAGPRFFFQRVPESKITKNRVHVDVVLAGGQVVPAEQRKEPLAAEVERLAGLGAEQVEVQEEFGQYWIVMRDPEGNEFCIS